MKKSKSLGLAVSVFVFIAVVSALRAAEDVGDYVLMSARIFISPSREVQVDEKTPAVRETMVFHTAANDADRETGKCILQYKWTRPPARLSSKALNKLEMKTEIAVVAASGEWTAQPKTIWPNLFFLKAGDTEVLDAAMAGK